MHNHIFTNTEQKYMIGYDRPTLCTNYHSFIYYSDSYMFRHSYAILRELLYPYELLERQQ
jgi:hypothetical protein